MISRRQARRSSIAVVGQAFCGTGFARVLQGLLPWLAKKFDVHHVGLDPRVPDPGTDLAWTLHPNPEPMDRFGVQTLADLVRQISPRAVLIMNSPWGMHHYLRALQPYRPAVAVVAYCPVDNLILYPESLASLRDLDHLVLYSQFAERAIRLCFAELRSKVPHFREPKISVIPHGTSTDLFRPVPDGHLDTDDCKRRATVRRHLIANRDLGDDAFIVLNPNRNQLRKRIDITLSGFALFARSKPENVKLWLHMGTREPGWDIIGLADQLGIRERILLTSASKDHPVVTEERLNLIYNCCDVGLNTSCAEGWGLASFEHAATGAAQIVPRHSACEELWHESAVMLEVSEIGRMEPSIQASLVSPQEVAKTLEKLYVDRAYRNEMSTKAFQNATRPEYCWQNIAEKWVQLLDQF
jgi:glycosyltransferase involved in cell wall biosynthesis